MKITDSSASAIGGTADAAGFIGARRQGDGAWLIDIGKERHGAFGGAFGGYLAACCTFVAREEDPTKTPVAIDSRFLRGLPAGPARFTATLIHRGRSLSAVSVDVADGTGRLCTRTLVSLADRRGLKDRDHDGPAERPSGHKAWVEGKPWRHPPGITVPIIDTFQPRAIGRDERGDGVALPVPWSDREHGAEAVCLAADISVGGPVAAAFRDDPGPAPNPDLSIRVLDDHVGGEVAAFARLERITAGVAAVQVQIWGDQKLVGVAICSSMLVR